MKKKHEIINDIIKFYGPTFPTDKLQITERQACAMLYARWMKWNHDALNLASPTERHYRLFKCVNGIIEEINFLKNEGIIK
ncbi:MAG: hypothetical protein PHS93_08300 [Candidatus Omnitrophica bacterium]|nr:hypothetical protein [Candidatus Omnitrophota bacterium]MDD5589133.1 hypothetical protein [Candidatus Nanoarchaeia archaeon]